MNTQETLFKEIEKASEECERLKSIYELALKLPRGVGLSPISDRLASVALYKGTLEEIHRKAVAGGAVDA